MKLENDFFPKLLFKLFEDVFKVKIASNSYAAYELICAELCQKEPLISKFNISRDSLMNFSKRKSRIMQKIKKIENDRGLSEIQMYEFFGEQKTFKEIKLFLFKLLKENTKFFVKILKDETVRNRVFQYHSLTFNDVWCFDFTTLEMFNKCSSSELFIIMDLSSRKIVGWKIFPSKKDVSSKSLIEIISNSITEFGKPKILHSDCDIKNHSEEFNLWAQNNEGIDVSITKDMFDKNHFAHGNQVIERFNRTLKGYFRKLDNSKRFLNFEYNQLDFFISSTINFYNKSTHATLSSKSTLISPDQAFFDHAIFDALKESWTLFKIDNNEKISSGVEPINIKDNQQLTEFMVTRPEFVDSFKNAEPSSPESIHNIFNQFLQSIAPLVYESSDSLVQKYFDDQLPNRVKGPGRNNIPGPYYYSFKNIKTSFSFTVASLLSLFSFVMAKVVQIQTEVILKDAKMNKEEIIETLKAEIVKNRLEMQLLLQKIEYLENIQKKAEERDLQLNALREKRKNRVIQDKRSAINLGEFIESLDILKKRFDSKKSMTFKFNAARDRIALFVLYFSGLRVSNLLLLSVKDIEKFFIYGNEKGVSVVLIKKKEKLETQQLIFSQAVVNKYIYGEYKLIEDFLFVKDYIFEFNKNSKNPKQEDSLKFYCSFKSPLKPLSRQWLTSNINSILKEVIKKGNSGTRVLSSHSCRINVISQMIKHYGYSYAQEFAHHSDIKTTALYNRNVFDPRMTRKLTGILAETRTGKKLKTNKDKDFFEKEASNILKNSD